jgi:hypothetical protein
LWVRFKFSFILIIAISRASAEFNDVWIFEAAAAVIGTTFLRKIGKIKASIWINAVALALAYILLVAVVNYLAGTVL